MMASVSASSVAYCSAVRALRRGVAPVRWMSAKAASPSSDRSGKRRVALAPAEILFNAARRETGFLVMGTAILARGAVAEEREELADLLLARLAAIFADLEGLGVFDPGRALRSVPLREPRTELVRGGAEARGEAVAHLLAARLLGRGVRGQPAFGRVAAPAFVELRGHGVHHDLHLLVDDVVDPDHDVAAEGVRLLEAVLGEQEHGVALEGRHLRPEERDLHHVGRVHHQ